MSTRWAVAWVLFLVGCAALAGDVIGRHTAIAELSIGSE